MLRSRLLVFKMTRNVLTLTTSLAERSQYGFKPIEHTQSWFAIGSVMPKRFHLASLLRQDKETGYAQGMETGVIQ